MKNIVRIFLLVVGVFTLNGCSKEVVTDVSSLNYLDSSSKENIAYNLSLVAEQIKSAKFDGEIVFNNKQYKFSGEVIVGNTIKDSIIHINYKDNNLYLRKGKIYLSYMYNNTNVIIKDSLENYTKEVASLLENKGIKCSYNKILNGINNKEIYDINFFKISDMLVESDSGFIVKKDNLLVSLNKDYLPMNLEYTKNNIFFKLNLDYKPVSISIPIGYDLVDMKISSIKDLLKVDNISDLLK